MKKFSCITICILMAASLLSAQEWRGQGRIPGLVFDEQGNPLEGVQVKLTCPQWNGGFEVKTNKEGKWSGAWMRTGLWNLDFEKLGYMPVHKSFQMNQFEKYKDMKVTMKKVEGLVITDDMKKDLTDANAIYDKKDYPAAIEAYKAFLVKFPDAFYIWKNIGNSYFLQEKYAEAEEAYKQVLAKDANDIDSNISIGNCYSNRGETDKAMEWYGKVQIDKIKDSNALYGIGIAYFKMSQLDNARKYLEKAVELEDSNLDALYQLGLTFTALENKDQAIAIFEKYLKIDPDSDRSTQVKGFLDYLKKK